jgi:hypothetical protein
MARWFSYIQMSREKVQSQVDEPFLDVKQFFVCFDGSFTSPRNKTIRKEFSFHYSIFIPLMTHFRFKLRAKKIVAVALRARHHN